LDPVGLPLVGTPLRASRAVAQRHADERQPYKDTVHQNRSERSAHRKTKTSP
jgi:hypothetical protein